MKGIFLQQFSNTWARQLGLTILNMAESRNQHIAVCVARLNHTVFLAFSNEVTADKHSWLKRKANVAIRFEESSLQVKDDLLKRGITLSNYFGLSDNDYVAKGGSIPIFVEHVGLVATVTVSGLPDTDDHQLIVDACKQIAGCNLI